MGLRADRADRPGRAGFRPQTSANGSHSGVRLDWARLTQTGSADVRSGVSVGRWCGDGAGGAVAAGHGEPQCREAAVGRAVGRLANHGECPAGKHRSLGERSPRLRQASATERRSRSARGPDRRVVFTDLPEQLRCGWTASRCSPTGRAGSRRRGIRHYRGIRHRRTGRPGRQTSEPPAAGSPGGLVAVRTGLCGARTRPCTNRCATRRCAHHRRPWKVAADVHRVGTACPWRAIGRHTGMPARRGFG
jgi:hypothetical protein